MSDPTIRGIVHVIEDTKTFGKNDFRKRVVVLEQDKGRFTNYIPVEFVHEGCDTVDELNLGDDVEVTYRLSGRKWQRDANSETKYFLNAEATNFKVLSKSSANNDSPPPDSFDDGAPAVEDDEIPF